MFILVVLVGVVIFLWSPQKTAKDHHLNDAYHSLRTTKCGGWEPSEFNRLAQHTQGVPSLGMVCSRNPFAQCLLVCALGLSRVTTVTLVRQNALPCRLSPCALARVAI